MIKYLLLIVLVVGCKVDPREGLPPGIDVYINKKGDVWYHPLCPSTGKHYLSTPFRDNAIAERKELEELFAKGVRKTAGNTVQFLIDGKWGVPTGFPECFYATDSMFVQRYQVETTVHNGPEPNRPELVFYRLDFDNHDRYHRWVVQKIEETKCGYRVYNTKDFYRCNLHEDWGNKLMCSEREIIEWWEKEHVYDN